MGHIFMVNGGAAMHLNNAFGGNRGYKRLFVKGNSPVRSRRKTALNSESYSKGTTKARADGGQGRLSQQPRQSMRGSDSLPLRKAPQAKNRPSLQN